ncbi:MAG: DinB family protein [Chitinophagaceae bacterium]|jgi:uncharacterized damage-inducible protein DinB|nr:DinB family protein [Chitinophagaceae bacterium]
MFRNLAEFNGTWTFESEQTLKILEQLTDISLSQSVCPGGRTLGRLANHLIETLTEMPHRLGLGLEEEHPAYTRAADIVVNYMRCSDQLLGAINRHWTDASLDETADMYGEKWTNRFSLGVLVNHQIHHRAQMTVLMRQAGLKVPGIYGPSKEEWEHMGVPAQP